MNIAQWDRDHLWRFRAYAWRPIDGDTFVALPDLGFGGSAFPHIRLLDVWKPESDEAGGNEATVALWSILGMHPSVKWPLRIESKIRERVVEGTKTFDRYVATVWVVTPMGEMRDVRELLG